MLVPFETTNLADDEQEVNIIESNDNISKNGTMKIRECISDESKIIVLILNIFRLQSY